MLLSSHHSVIMSKQFTRLTYWREHKQWLHIVLLNLIPMSTGMWSISFCETSELSRSISTTWPILFIFSKISRLAYGSEANHHVQLVNYASTPHTLGKLTSVHLPKITITFLDTNQIFYPVGQYRISLCDDLRIWMFLGLHTKLRQ